MHIRGAFRRFVVSGRAEPTPDTSVQAEAQLLLRYRLAIMVADGYADEGFLAVVQHVVGPVTANDTSCGSVAGHQ